MKKILLFPLRVLQHILLLSWLVIAGSLATLVALFSFSPKAGHWVVKNIYCRGFHVLLGFTPTCSGLERLDYDKVYVFASNHESHMDTQSIYMNYPKNLHFIAKKELKYTPIVGWVIAALGMIFIDRKNRERAQASLTKAAGLIRNGKNVISFPEGTRTKDGDIKRFKKGLFALALEAGVDVVPVAVSGAREVMASGSMVIHPGPIHIAFGSPVDHTQFIGDPEGFANQVREEVIQMKEYWDEKRPKMRP
ncbi:MAG: 1-acyl-sn-glycerol-3-phosphate acyltransferase [Flavobacteriales bacterium]|nr:1-acyl-sn-glycerol-3-phosphate acyltransferase [Flavobacteriales bacterium]